MVVSTTGPVRRRTAAVAVALALALVACGGASEVADPGVLRLTGQDNLLWDRTELAASAGTVTFELTCEAGVNHNLVIEATAEQVAACAPGGRSTGSVELSAGTYVYLCTVPGHEVTMRGTLVVS